MTTGFLDFSESEGEISLSPEPYSDGESILIGGFSLKISAAQSEALFHELLLYYMGKGKESKESVIARILGPWLKAEIV